jgi:hypothetical protein
LATYSVPTRGFTAVVSVFGGTPSKKPLNCKSLKSFPGQPGARLRQRWAEPTGEERKLFGAIFSWVRTDIVSTSLFLMFQSFAFRSLPVTVSFRETKNPAYTW